MALIVEDGTGRADAESYTSVAEADAYHTARGNAAWGPLETTVKEQLLRKATDYLEGVFALSWPSRALTATQLLSWPRYAVTIAGFPGQYVSGVPKKVKDVTAELALIAKDTSLMPVATRGRKRVKVGSLEVEYDGEGPVSNQFAAILRSLNPLFGVGNTGFQAKVYRT